MSSHADVSADQEQQLQLYGDDPQHPIATLGNVDVAAKLPDGRTQLSIVVATPLAADARSQQRLMQKIQNYLDYINGEAFWKEFGPPSVQRTHVVVKLARGSDPLIAQALERCEEWVAGSNAKLIVE